MPGGYRQDQGVPATGTTRSIAAVVASTATTVSGPASGSAGEPTVSG